MKKFNKLCFINFILLFSFNILSAQHFGIHMGYGNMFDKGIVDYASGANALYSLQQSANAPQHLGQNSFQKTSTLTQYTPMSIEFGMGDAFEIGLKYVFTLNRPNIYYPIQESNIIGVKESMKYKQLGLYLNFRTKDYSDEFEAYLLFGLEGGRRWAKKIIEYTDDFHRQGVEAMDESIKIKAAFYGKVSLGVGYILGDGIAFELKGFAIPLDKYQLHNTIDKHSTTSFGLMAGFKFMFNDSYGWSPCL